MNNNREKQEELIGTVQRFISGDPESSWISIITDKRKKACGSVDPGLVFVGKEYRFFGTWETHPTYGPQMKFSVVIPHQGHTRTSVVDYLLHILKNKGTGIGEKKAHALYSEYGNDVMDAIRDGDPQDIASLLKIDYEGASKAKEILEEFRATEHTRIELGGLLGGKGFYALMTEKLIEKWGMKSVDIIRRDPFKLLTHKFPSAGFLRVDDLYISLGLNPAKMKRQVLCAWDHAKKKGGGNTWNKEAVAMAGIYQKIGGTDVKPERAIEIGVRAGLFARKEVDGVTYLAEREHAANEERVAKAVRRLSGSANHWPNLIFQDEDGETCYLDEDHLMTHHQHIQLAMATKKPIGVLAGTPGTGKTFTLAHYLKVIPGNYAVCAPTGKAASRASEMLGSYGITVSATTIHTMLQARPDGDNWTFEFDEDNPLPYDFIFVDESSMIDTDIMAAFLSACKTGTHVLFIGDPYQLPPVGHGSPMKDIMEVVDSVGTLTEVQRNAGHIVLACKAIKEKRSWKAAAQFKLPTVNLIHVQAPSSWAVIQTLTSMYAKIAERDTYDIFDDVQILIARNTAGDVSRKVINELVQNIVNPSATIGQYRVDDKVMCLKNEFYKAKKGKIKVYNGEQGRVLSVNTVSTAKGPVQDLVKVRFPDIKDGQGVREIHAKVRFASDDKNKFDLAYAVTVHKAQGSEWPVVICIADEGGGLIANQEWWYTAISRAKDRCVILGDSNIVLKQCSRQGQARKTFLRELISCTTTSLEKTLSTSS